MCLFLSPFVPCRTQLRHGRSALVAIKFALEDSRPGSRARSNLHLMDGSQKASVPTVHQTVKPPGKPDGPCFSPVSIFLLPIGQVLIMWNRTLYPSSSDWVLLWGPNWHCTHPATYLHHWDHCMGNWVIVPRSTGTRPLACLCLLYKMDYGFQATGGEDFSIWRTGRAMALKNTPGFCGQWFWTKPSFESSTPASWQEWWVASRLPFKFGGYCHGSLCLPRHVFAEWCVWPKKSVPPHPTTTTKFSLTLCIWHLVIV